VSVAAGLSSAQLTELNLIRGRVVALLQQVGLGMCQIGRELAQVKALLPHGQFGLWVETNLQISQRKAERLMAVARRLGDKSASLSGFSAGVLYELASPSTPDEVVRRVLSGEIPPAIAAIKSAGQREKPRSGSAVEDAAVRLVSAFESFLDVFDEDEAVEEIGVCVAGVLVSRYTQPEAWAEAFTQVATATEEALRG